MIGPPPLLLPLLGDGDADDGGCTRPDPESVIWGLEAVGAVRPAPVPPTAPEASPAGTGRGATRSATNARDATRECAGAAAAAEHQRGGVSGAASGNWTGAFE